MFRKSQKAEQAAVFNYLVHARLQMIKAVDDPHAKMAGGHFCPAVSEDKFTRPGFHPSENAHAGQTKSDRLGILLAAVLFSCIFQIANVLTIKHTGKEGVHGKFKAR